MNNELANLVNTIEVFLQKDTDFQQKKEKPWREEFSKMVEMIEHFGFEILSFSKPLYLDNGYLIKGIYQCAYNGWVFNVVHRKDEEELKDLLFVYCFANAKTLETFEYMVDLTELTQYRLHGRSHEFVQLMTLGEKEYLHQRYGHYLELPSLLTKHGYTVTEISNFTFVLDNNKSEFETLNDGWFVIDNQIQISVRRGIKENSTQQEDYLLLENFKPLDFESKNEEHWFSFHYNSEKDLPSLLSFLTSLKKQYDGSYGYLENGTFYKNKHVELLFSLHELKEEKYSSSEPGMFLDKKKTIKMYDCTPQYKEEKKVNPTLGIDLLKEYQFFLRNEPKETDEYIYQKIHFSFAYNKQVNEQECLLTITHEAIMKKKGRKLAKNYWEFKDEVLSSQTVEIKGSFLTCINEWKAFLIRILEKEGLVPHSDLLKI